MAQSHGPARDAVSTITSMPPVGSAAAGAAGRVTPPAGRRPWLAGIGGLAGVVLIGFLDRATGTELAFSAFYLLPIGYAAWFGNRSVGLAVAVAGALAFPVTDLLGGRVFTAPAIVAWNAAIRLATYVVVVVLLTSLLRQLAYATQTSRTDALTGLVRGNHLLELLSDEIQRSQRYDRAFSAAYLDVDDFKHVNDTLGHAAGDAVLRSVGDALRLSTRATDVGARMGGDEFLVLMPETGSAAARTTIERLQRALAAVSTPKEASVTFSIGVVTFEHPPTSAEEAVKLVDGLMYAVKRSGKNGFRHEVVRQQP